MLQTNKKSFTLIEAVMATVIVGIIAAVFALVISSGMTSWLFMRGQKGMLMDASSALQRMTREIKRANTVALFSINQFQFTDLSNNVITYQQDGASLLRNGAVLLNNLSGNGLQFLYLNNSGAIATSATDIKIVQIMLQTQSGSNQVRLMSAAGIRVR